MSRGIWALILLAALIGVAIFLACGSSGSRGTTLTTVTLSDPTTCAAPKGPFSNIYVTVLDVQVNKSSSAGDNDSGWQSAIPDKKGTPQQVDLLGAADTRCFLKQLGSTTQLDAGAYQQIRVILADNANAPTQNACGTVGANCVMLTKDQEPRPAYPLLLSSQAQTGIKIPADQITGGKFVVEAGQQKDLNIDFNSCASIVTQGNGGFRLKPVLHAGEVEAVSSISGRIVDSATHQPIAGADVVVALEVNDAGTEIVKMQMRADDNGNFNFCPVSPLASGTYDVVAVAIKGSTAYGVTITTGVSAGAAMGDIPVTAVGNIATINGTVTAQTGGTTGATAFIAVSALQKVTVGGSDVNFLIPLATQGAVTIPLVTEAGTCPTNTFCKGYSMILPAAKPALGTFNLANPSWTNPVAGADYFINGTATQPSGNGQPDCTQPSQTTAAVPVVAGDTKTAPQLDFVGCQ